MCVNLVTLYCLKLDSENINTNLILVAEQISSQSHNKYKEKRPQMLNSDSYASSSLTHWHDTQTAIEQMSWGPLTHWMDLEKKKEKKSQDAFSFIFGISSCWCLMVAKDGRCACLKCSLSHVASSVEYILILWGSTADEDNMTLAQFWPWAV